MIKMELEGVTDVCPADAEFNYMFTVRRGSGDTGRAAMKGWCGLIVATPSS
jgi:superfamily II DNA/RNA helicase